jgi:hypothetical protein
VVVLARRERALALHRHAAGARVIEEDRAEQDRIGLDVDALNAQQERFAAEFLAATGRRFTNLRDIRLIREETALAIIDEQIKELRGPALLVLFGGVISTAGSLLSLWV